MPPEAPTQAQDTRGRRRVRNYVLVAVAVVTIVLFFLGVPLYLMSQPSFLARYHGFADNYQSLQASAHRGIACGQCHGGRWFAYRAQLTVGFYKGLIVRNSDVPVIEMQTPTSQACRKCHIEDWSYRSERTSRIPHPAHLRVVDETRDCVTCHKWTAHQENTFLQKHKKMPFSGVCVSYGCHVGWKTKDQCANCHHVLYEGAQEWKKDHPKVVRVAGDLGCLETCHEVAQCRECHNTGKTPVFKGLAIQTGLKVIEVQHAKPNWIDQHGTLALQDESKCLQCHVTVGECQSCHARRPAFHGSTATWIGTHNKIAKKVDNPRCLTCHKKAWCDDCHARFKEMQ